MERAISTTAAVEEWRPVKGYEGLYEVSNLGRVRSLDRWINSEVDNNGIIYTRKAFFKSHILKSENVRGYPAVNLSIHSLCKTMKIHRLVAEAFIPNPSNLEFINHKDEDKTNNHVENLEWCTRLYNNTYGTRCARQSKSLCKKVEQLSLNGEHIAFYPSATAAIKNTGIKHIAAVLALKSKGNVTAGGYRWRYVDK